MRHFVHRRAGLLLVLALLTAVVAAAALPGMAFGGGANDPPSLQQVYDATNNELSGQNALTNVAFVYRGWRNNGGPWFNQVLDWLGTNLATYGFANGQGASGAHYWIQSDYRPGSVWVPQHLSMQIVGPDGDADPGNPAAYHFDHPAVNTFDPTSSYYPSYMTQEWVMAHIGTPEEAAIQDRCHLARDSAFTSPLNTDLTTADANAIVADLVDVGTVSTSGTRTWSKHSSTSLLGKILFSQTARMTDLMNLASQQLAKAVMTPAALAAYSHPTIDGVEWYPNNVRYASGGSSVAPTRVSLNISYQDARYLTTLCALKDVTGEFPQMKLFAVGGTVPYSVAPDTTTMLRTVIAEIPGTDPNPAIANQRVVYAAHVQEPGACDNASGVGALLETVRTYKHLIDTGALPPPKRTLTFFWGAETTMGGLWKGQNLAAFNSTQAALDLDMVGEDPVKTGGIVRIDKIPDPSSQYKYGIDVLPGTTPPLPTQFVRGPDLHTLWGQPAMQFWPYPGHFLTDLCFEAGKLVTAGSPEFQLGSNPSEGGSDHDTFVWNKDASGNWDPKPAVLACHFTDYVYHSSMDTMGVVNTSELHGSAVTFILVGYDVATADVNSAGEVIDIVQAAAHQRFDWERDNSTAHFFWALLNPYGSPTPSTDAALHEAFTGTGNSSSRSIGETQILTEWGDWYKQAVNSARTIFDPADNTPAYDAHEAAALAAVDADMQDALAKADHLFAVSHFSGAMLAINGGAEWSTTPDVTLTLAASSVAPGGVTGMRFSDDGSSWPAGFELYATSKAYTLPAGDGAKTVYAQFQDSEGNISDPVQASIKLDTTPPVITLTTPVAGATYLKGQAVSADWSTWDAYSGVASQWGTVASGAPLDTASFGAKSFTVTATDVAGNSATTTLGYSVPFATKGLQGPLNDKGNKLELKFELLDADGRSVTTATPVLHLAKLVGGAWGPEFDPVSHSKPKTSTVFTYEKKPKEYRYDLNTKVLKKGTYRLRIDLGGGAEFSAQITIK